MKLNYIIYFVFGILFLDSAMGSVTLLSGVPKEGVFVEARSETKGFYEEATTDNLGNFRLRGLLPDTTYLVRAVAKENLGAVAIERASPEYVAVNVSCFPNHPTSLQLVSYLTTQKVSTVFS